MTKAEMPSRHIAIMNLRTYVTILSGFELIFKPFYVLDQHTGEKLYVDSFSAWFDTVNQYHGSDPADGLTFSIRVDGRFTDEFAAKIPRPGNNAASTPSYWAAIEGKV